MAMSEFERAIREEADRLKIKELEEDIRLHKIRIAMLERQYDDLLKQRFTEDDQRNQWEAAWNLVYEETGASIETAIEILEKHFHLVPKTQFTQQHYEGK